MVMRNLILIGLCSWVLISCDKIDDPYQEQEYTTTASWGLYPYGDSADYVANYWPTFTANTNSLRNMLIEDFTGHKCVYCAPAGDTAHTLHLENPDRVFATSIHAGPGDGSVPAQPGAFQTVDAEFTLLLYNQAGLDIGQYFGFNWSGTSFIANPSGNVSRVTSAGQIFSSPTDWRTRINANINATLKVNLQSEANYFSETNGVFLHTEVDVLDGGLNPDSLYTVVYLIQDSIVGKQKMPPPTPTDDNYVHRDVMRAVVGSPWKGQAITSGTQENGKYYFFYTYDLDDMNTLYGVDAVPENFHFLIYVRDNTTEEIYHVIEQDIQ